MVETADRDAAPAEDDPHAALAAARTRIANLEVALVTNRRIGMAVGILMARHKLTEQAAFELLRRVSQDTQRKLREVADRVVFTGELGEDD